MSERKLRLRPRICYEELDEPKFDEYIYCDACCGFVYEYCTIHGSLLVIPDSKVPANHDASLPCALFTLPDQFLCFGTSAIPGAGVGVFSTVTLPRGARFGPYRGAPHTLARSGYCWQIRNGDCTSHVIDGFDANYSNWMRFVNCSRHYVEQNLLAYQYKGHIYYRTIRIIPRNTELLVYYGSQYADKLNIDLSKYNNKNAYLQAISVKSGLTNDAERQASVLKENKTLSNLLEISEKTTNSLAISPQFIYTEPENTEYNIDGNQLIDETSSSYDINMSEHEFSYNLNITDHSYQEFNNFDKQSNGIKPESEAYIDSINSNVQSNVDDMYNFSERNIDNVVKYQCNVCEGFVNSKSSARRHAKIHSVKMFSCTECEYKTNFKHILIRHMCTHYGNNYNCSLCTFSTNTARNLKNHKENIHYKIRKTCPNCNYQNFSQLVMERHIKLHEKANAKKCESCDYLYDITRNYLRHSLTVHGVNSDLTNDEKRQISVSEQNKTLPNLLQSFIKEPSNSDDNIIEHELSFNLNTTDHTSSQIELNNFNEQSNDIKPESESDIDSLNSSANSNVENMYNFSERNIDNVVKYQCNVCERTVNSKSSARRHAKIHSVKMFNCTECEYKTNFKYSLIRHMCTHRGNSYNCSLCTFSTNTARNLRKHKENVHYKIRKICPHCNYKIFSQIVMSHHIKLHEKANAKKCDSCDYLYVITNNYSRHLLAVHGKTN